MAPPPDATNFGPSVSVAYPPFSAAPQPQKPAPFVAKHVVPPGTIKLEPNESRKAELRRIRRKNSLNRACDKFLDSTWVRWTKRLATLLMLGFLLSTYYYMKRHKWRPWWATQDQREIELLRLREAKAEPPPAAQPDSFPSLPVAPPSDPPSHATLDNISLIEPPSALDPLERAARLNP